MLSAWLLVLTLDAGRVFNYPAGSWTMATTPGVEVSRGLFTLNASISYDRAGYFARDLSASLEKEVGRLTLSVNAGRYDYPGYQPDLSAGVSLRWRIK